MTGMHYHIHSPVSEQICHPHVWPHATPPKPREEAPSTPTLVICPQVAALTQDRSQQDSAHQTQLLTFWSWKKWRGPRQGQTKICGHRHVHIHAHTCTYIHTHKAEMSACWFCHALAHRKWNILDPTKLVGAGEGCVKGACQV